MNAVRVLKVFEKNGSLSGALNEGNSTYSIDRRYVKKIHHVRILRAV